MRSKWMLIGLSFLLLVGFAAACGQAQQGTSPTATSAPSEAETGEKPKLTVWLSKSFTTEADEKVKELAETYAEQNGIELEMVQDSGTVMAPKWEAALETKQLPDVGALSPDFPAKFHNAGVLLDVSDVVSSLNEIGEGYTEGALEAVTFDGRQYAVPTRTTSMFMHVRKDLLEEAGLEPPGTWEDVIQVGKALTKPGEVWGWGHALGLESYDAEVHTLSILMAYGASYYGEDGETPFLSSPGSLEVLNMIKDAWDAEVIPPDSVTWDDAGNNKAYQTESVAMAYNPASILWWAQENDEELYENTMVVPVPRGPEGRYAAGYVYSMGVFNTTEHPELAKGLVEYVLEPQNYKEAVELAGAHFMPTHKRLRDPEVLPMWENPRHKAIMENAANTVPLGFPGPTNLWVLEAWDRHTVTQMFNRVVVDGWTPEEAAEEADQTLQEIYESFH